MLAYSTVSQLGFMFIGVGVGAYWAGDLPPVDPRLLQGLPLPRRRLGDARHAATRPDIRKMGGLREAHAAAPTGPSWSPPSPPPASCRFSGFWSKDAILGARLFSHNPDWHDGRPRRLRHRRARRRSAPPST
ncbi:MAG: hypothetical protein MZW92_24245 [Comamonadaceae bacterium]|nr:hypothetical protein [Comamonadaceae bacterium]